MVNHFATLLANINLKEYYYLVSRYAVLQDSGSTDVFSIPKEPGAYLSLSSSFAYPEATLHQSLLLNKDYVKITLPTALQKFHELLFPPSRSLYYNQFLLYCYLKIIESTAFSSHVKKYDTRVAYRLDEIEEYFRLSKISEIVSSQKAYNLLIFGNYQPSAHTDQPVNTFTVSQIPYTNKIFIYSNTDRRYYRYGSAPSTSKEGMENSLVISEQQGDITKPIKIGDTGLSFSIGGNLGELDSSSEFVNSSYKSWKFSAEYSMQFDFKSRFTELLNSETVVADMLDFSRDLCDISYENVWNQHFNDLYRFAGLLLGYVERVHLVWETKLT